MHAPGSTPRGWDQPILVQPEVGILGLLGRVADGELRFLVQVKPEPGLGNQVQVAPTVQATFSNYTRVHGGKSQPFLDYFLGPRAGCSVVVDELLSEQGGRFWRKCNRNLVVITHDDVVAPGGGHWLTLSQLIRLLRHDQLLNFDLRNVLSRLILSWVRESPHLSSILAPARGDSVCWHWSAESAGRVMSTLEGLQARSTFSANLIPLSGCAGWRCDPRAVAHEGGRFFEVVAAHIVTGMREVREWGQPFIRPTAPGLVRVVSVPSGDGERWLVRARREAGDPALMLVPAVQTHDRHLPSGGIPGLGVGSPGRVVFASEQSEEGGRFLGETIRYEVIESDVAAAALGDGWFCLTLGELVLIELCYKRLNSHLRHLLTLYLAHRLRGRFGGD